MVVAGIASIFPRQDALERVIDSISPQVDKVYVSLNDYPQVPLYASKYGNVEFLMNSNENGDASKFACVDKVDGYYLSCDDDLVYPPHYVDYMTSRCDYYKAIVTLHGKIYDRTQLPVKSFRRSIKTNIRCLNGWDKDIEIDIGGTGCLCYHTDFFKLTLDAFPYKNMADVQLSLEAHKQGVKIIALAHPGNYLQYLRPKDLTIWQTTTDDSIQTRILNEFLK